MFEEEYADAFAAADALVVAPRVPRGAPRPKRRIDRDALVAGFERAGKPAFAPGSLDEIPGLLRSHARAGDVLLLMSSGAFGGLPGTLLDGLTD